MPNGKSQETLLQIIEEFNKQSLQIRHLNYALDHALDTIQALEDEIQMLKVQASQSFAEVAQTDDDDTIVAPRRPSSEERWIAGLWCSTPETVALFGSVEDAWHSDLENPQSALNMLRSMQNRAHYNTGDRIWFQLLEAAILCNHRDTNDAFPLVSQVLQQCNNYEYKQQRGIAFYLQARLYITQSNWLAAHWLLAKAQCTEGYRGTIQDWLAELARRIGGVIGPDPVVQSHSAYQYDVPRYPTGSPIEAPSFVTGSQSPCQERIRTTADNGRTRKARPSSLELVHAAFDPEEAELFKQKYGNTDDQSSGSLVSTIRSPLSPTPSQLAAEQELDRRLTDLAEQKNYAEITEILGSVPKHARPAGWAALESVVNSVEPSNSSYRQFSNPENARRTTAPGSFLLESPSQGVDPPQLNGRRPILDYEDLRTPDRDETRVLKASSEQTANTATSSKQLRKLA